MAAANPALYRHIALYLQVLRSVLPGRVRQACFHLATQVHASRYLRLSESERSALHSHLEELVARCCSLLTVEQLSVLAGQLAREEQQRQQQRQQQLLQQLIRRSEADASEDDEPADGPSGQAVAGESGPDLPPGSVRLDLSPPWAGGSFAWPAAARSAGRSEALLPEDFFAAAQLDSGDFHPAEADFEPAGDDSAVDGFEASDLEAADPSRFGQQSEAIPSAEPNGAALLREALQQAGGMAALFDPAAIEAVLAAAQPSAAGEGPAPPGAGPPLEAAPSSSGSLAQPGESPGLLPRDPLALLQWLDSIERALARRLRTLSHAINVDLLRFGLSRGLLPLSLLEAVLQGQMETLASPANLLRLQLPFGLRPGAPPLQALAILLRLVDLEMEEPRLRTCRRRLQQHRQEVRRMAHQYRRLQRRLQAHEAERLWLQDLQRIRRTPD